VTIELTSIFSLSLCSSFPCILNRDADPEWVCASLESKGSIIRCGMSQPHFGAKCENATHTPKSGKMESFGTLENSEDDLRGQISLPWCVPYINEKVLKRRCPKWTCMGHLDICSPSYGQKKGQESNYQFDSRPLKVKNRPLPDVASKSVTRRWKALQLWFKPRPDPSSRRGAMSVQSPGTLTWDNFGTLTWESREKEPFGCSLGGELQSILYGGRWWLPLSPGRGESCVSKCPWLVPTPKGVPEC